jgi:hypothetical protein
VSTYSKSLKNRICRGAIDLQLSQRATYVLLNRFSEKHVEVPAKLGPEITMRSSFNTNLSNFALKIGMYINYEKCVPGNNGEIVYWPILNFYSEI